MTTVTLGIDLADLEMQMISALNRENILKNTIEDLKKHYDYILIDCPSSLGMLSINALSASNEVLIPVQAQYLPARALSKKTMVITSESSTLSYHME